MDLGAEMNLATHYKHKHPLRKVPGATFVPVKYGFAISSAGSTAPSGVEASHSDSRHMEESEATETLASEATEGSAPIEIDNDGDEDSVSAELKQSSCCSHDHHMDTAGDSAAAAILVDDVAAGGALADSERGYGDLPVVLTAAEDRPEWLASEEASKPKPRTVSVPRERLSAR